MFLRMRSRKFGQIQCKLPSLPAMWCGVHEPGGIDSKPSALAVTARACLRDWRSVLSVAGLEFRVSDVGFGV